MRINCPKWGRTRPAEPRASAEQADRPPRSEPWLARLDAQAMWLAGTRRHQAIAAAVLCVLGLAVAFPFWLRHRAYVADARQALSALHDLQSVVHSGVTYQEYCRRVNDCRIQVDRFLRAQSQDRARFSRTAIGSAMDAYEEARDKWWAKIEDPSTAPDEPAEDAVRLMWLKGRARIASAEWDLAGRRGRAAPRADTIVIALLAEYRLVEAKRIVADGDLEAALTAHDPNAATPLFARREELRKEMDALADEMTDLAPWLIAGYDAEGHVILAINNPDRKPTDH